MQQAVEQLASQSAPGRRSARLYQPLEDRTALLYVAEWDTREAFEAYRQHAPMPGSADQHRQHPACRFYRRLALFERVLTPIERAYASIVDGPAASHPVRVDLALAYHRESVRTQPHLTLLTIHEAIEGPRGLLLLCGRRASVSPHPHDDEPARALMERLLATGATVDELVGHVVADTPGA